MRQPESILIYPIRFHENNLEILLLHRVARPDLGLPAFWQGITGGVEFGENYHQAAERELAEETGLIVDTLVPIDSVCRFPMQETWIKNYPPGTEEIEEHSFLLLLKGGERIMLSGEHDRYAFFTLEQALTRLHYPNNRESLSRALALFEF